MPRNLGRLSSVLCAGLVLQIMLTQPAAGAEDSNRQTSGQETASSSANAAAEVNAVFEKVSQLIASADKDTNLLELANAVADEMYDDHALVVGEGMPGAVRGREACVDLLKQVLEDLGPGAQIVYRVRQAVYSDQVASMLVQVDSRSAAAPLSVKTYRAMYTFERGARGWRVVIEYFGVGPA